MSAAPDPSDYEKLPDFNIWLDEQYLTENEELDILGFKPRPSYVLHQMQFTVYETALADFREEQEEKLKETILNEYPSSIAYYFYRFLYGSENEIQKLHFLRDTWEACINTLHALAVSEARILQLNLAGHVKFESLLSDRLGDRLANIEEIFDVASARSVSMCVRTIVSKAVLFKMRELNRTRNAFSHSAAISEEQAQQYIAECHADVLEVLAELKALKEFKMLRYLSQEGLTKVKCESFEGHAMTRTIKKTDLTKPQVNNSGHYLQKDQILVVCPNYLLAPRPFVFFQQDGGGHSTRLCFFKKAKGAKPNRKVHFEVVGESREIELDRSLFKPELDELRALTGLSPD